MEEEELEEANAIAKSTQAPTPNPVHAALQPERTLNRTGSGVAKSTSGNSAPLLLLALAVAVSLVGWPTG